jgi:hypothetical protein
MDGVKLTICDRGEDNGDRLANFGSKLNSGLVLIACKRARCRINSMSKRVLWSRMLIVFGSIAMLVGAVDPLEGSLIILPGSGLVMLGMFLGQGGRILVTYWAWVFILITIGVGALWALSALGGIGGRSGHSMWWGVLILPYPVGWLMAVGGLFSLLIRRFQRHRSG